MRGSRRLEASKQRLHLPARNLTRGATTWAESLHIATAPVIRRFLVRHGSHEQQKDHCIVHHDVMLLFPVLMAPSLVVIELAVSSVLGMTYPCASAPFHHQRGQGCESTTDRRGTVR
jgi:hypothetical protein